jgi:hypothetical protein
MEALCTNAISEINTCNCVKKHATHDSSFFAHPLLLYGLQMLP